MDEIREQADGAVAEGWPTEGFWSIDKVSELLGIPKGTLYQWRHEGRHLRSYKIGGAVKYDPADVRAYLLEGRKDVAA